MSDPDTTQTPGSVPAPHSALGSTPTPDSAPALGSTPVPGSVPAPGSTPTPGSVAAPGSAPMPGSVPAPTPRPGPPGGHESTDPALQSALSDLEATPTQDLDAVLAAGEEAHRRLRARLGDVTGT